MTGDIWNIAISETPTKAEMRGADYLKRRLRTVGVEVKIIQAGGDIPRKSIVLGTTGSFPALSHLAGFSGLDIDPTVLGEEGFLIRYLADQEIVVAAGADSRGVLYGASEIHDRVTGVDDLAKLDVQDRPRFPLRAYKMIPPLDDAFLIDNRINTIYLPTWLPLGTDLAGIYTGLKVMEELVGVRPEDGLAMQWHEQRAYRGSLRALAKDIGDLENQVNAYRKRIEELRELGLRVFLSRYEWAYPILTLCRRYFADEILVPETANSEKGISICLSSDVFQKIVRVTMEKSFELFPDIEGLVIYTSSEGGFGVPCPCDSCQSEFREFHRELAPGYLVPGKRRERGSAEVYFFHKWAFDLIYETVRKINPDLTIVRNSWDFQPLKSPRSTAFAHEYTPKDVILMPYTVATDTNLREPPNPQVVQWAKQGRGVAPKMCQLMEMHPRSNCFPNLIDDRMVSFYTKWADAGVTGTCVHGGWWVAERFSSHRNYMDNIGFGFNLFLHWKLMWNPYRNDIEDLWRKWVDRLFGVQHSEVLWECFRRAREIYRFGPEVKEKENPTYRDYMSYSLWAGAAAGGGQPGMYPFGFDMLLLCDKVTHKYLCDPSQLHEDFIYSYEDYPQFQKHLKTAIEKLSLNLSDLDAALEDDRGNQSLLDLRNWFLVMKDFIEGWGLLYEAEYAYLIEGSRSGELYLKSYQILRDVLTRWGRIALKQGVWPFNVGGCFYPYRGKTLDENWLESGAFGVFFTWLEARARSPMDPDKIESYESSPALFLKGLKEFRWPME